MDVDVESSPEAGLRLHQLALPLANAPAPAVAAPPTVAPSAVWTTLPPPTRLLLERTVRRVFAEVGRDANGG